MGQAFKTSDMVAWHEEAMTCLAKCHWKEASSHLSLVTRTAKTVMPHITVMPGPHITPSMREQIIHLKRSERVTLYFVLKNCGIMWNRLLQMSHAFACFDLAQTLHRHNTLISFKKDDEEATLENLEVIALSLQTSLCMRTVDRHFPTKLTSMCRFLYQMLHFSNSVPCHAKVKTKCFLLDLMNDLLQSELCASNILESLSLMTFAKDTKNSQLQTLKGLSHQLFFVEGEQSPDYDGEVLLMALENSTRALLWYKDIFLCRPIKQELKDIPPAEEAAFRTAIDTWHKLHWPLEHTKTIFSVLTSYIHTLYLSPVVPAICEEIFSTIEKLYNHLWIHMNLGADVADKFLQLSHFATVNVVHQTHSDVFFEITVDMYSRLFGKVDMGKHLESIQLAL